MSDVTRQQPVHPCAEGTVAKGANDKVDVVWHQTPGEQSHGVLRPGSINEVQERVEIGVVVEDGLPSVASGQDVIADVCP